MRTHKASVFICAFAIVKSAYAHKGPACNSQWPKETSFGPPKTHEHQKSPKFINSTRMCLCIRKRRYSFVCKFEIVCLPLDLDLRIEIWREATDLGSVDLEWQATAQFSHLHLHLSMASAFVFWCVCVCARAFLFLCRDPRARLLAGGRAVKANGGKWSHNGQSNHTSGSPSEPENLPNQRSQLFPPNAPELAFYWPEQAYLGGLINFASVCTPLGFVARCPRSLVKRASILPANTQSICELARPDRFSVGSRENAAMLQWY